MILGRLVDRCSAETCRNDPGRVLAKPTIFYDYL